MADLFSSEISLDIWDMKYRLKRSGEIVDETVFDTFRRIADAIFPDDPDRANIHFTEMNEGRFLPAGRIIAGAGSQRRVTLFNCFVAGTIEDSMPGIMDAAKSASLTLQQGGGIGMDFSTIRPKGALVRGVDADASGPLSFMEVWNTACATIMSAGSRRGAMMACLRCDHPDVLDFIEAKKTPGRFTNFNLSILVTDEFMHAKDSGAPWKLRFGGEVYRTVDARELWDAIMRATYAAAEPGVIFIDRINQQNNLQYCETISATNPCGEQALPPHGACLLGSVILPAFVSWGDDEHAFTEASGFDFAALKASVGHAVELLDGVIDVSNYPLVEQRDEAFQKRRIGLGVTGLADAMAFLGLRYGDDRSVSFTETVLRELSNAAYQRSALLARDKGSFPLFDFEKFRETPGFRNLSEETQEMIAEHGLRNGLLTSIAPTGTMSLFAGNVSSGIEPVFQHTYTRQVLEKDGSRTPKVVEDYAYAIFRKIHGPDAPLPAHMVVASDLTPDEHVAIQAAAQRFVDNAISKTVNVPEDISFDDFKVVYEEAYNKGCKGCTTYRPTPLRGSVLSEAPKEREAQTKETDDSVSDITVAVEAEGASTDASSNVVNMKDPLRREPSLEGRTYKIRWPGADHAYYITINDIDQNGRRRPYEIFCNTRNSHHHSWTVALTVMISAIFRRGGDVSFVAEQLKGVFDPSGGYFMGGRYVPSLLAAIGDVVENHLLSIGFLTEKEEPVKSGSIRAAGGCSRCGGRLQMQGGCDVCVDCGHSSCS